MVYLKLQPYRQRSLARKPFEKLAAKFYGPYEILQPVGKVAYRLKLPPASKLHPVFHVSQLRRAVGTLPVPPTIPEQLNSDMEMIVQPEQLLAVRRVGTEQSGQLEALLKWKDLPEFEATWEDVEAINARFPEFHLEGKVLVWGQGNVMHYTQPKTLKTFTRRKKKKNETVQGN